MVICINIKSLNCILLFRSKGYLLLGPLIHNAIHDVIHPAGELTRCRPIRIKGPGAGPGSKKAKGAFSIPSDAEVKKMILNDKLKKCTVPYLKAVLSNQELSTSGKKKDLVGRIAKHFAT